MSARPGLCGGHRATGVATAIASYTGKLSKAIPKPAYGRCTQGATSVLLSSEPNPTIPWWFHEPSEVFEPCLPVHCRSFPSWALNSDCTALRPSDKARPLGDSCKYQSRLFAEYGPRRPVLFFRWDDARRLSYSDEQGGRGHHVQRQQQDPYCSRDLV